MKVNRRCENCGNIVESEEDMLNASVLLEQHYECPHCGFRRHWAYGYVTPEDSEYNISEVPIT